MLQNLLSFPTQFILCKCVCVCVFINCIAIAKWGNCVILLFLKVNHAHTYTSSRVQGRRNSFLAKISVCLMPCSLLISKIEFVQSQRKQNNNIFLFMAIAVHFICITSNNNSNKSNSHIPVKSSHILPHNHFTGIWNGFSTAITEHVKISCICVNLYFEHLNAFGCNAI